MKWERTQTTNFKLKLSQRGCKEQRWWAFTLFFRLAVREAHKSCISNRSCRATNLHKNVNQGLHYTYPTAPQYCVS